MASGAVYVIMLGYFTITVWSLSLLWPVDVFWKDYTFLGILLSMRRPYKLKFSVYCFATMDCNKIMFIQSDGGKSES